MNNKLTQKLNISFPLIMAPMFLVSNIEMLKAAIDSGIAGVTASLNYLNSDDLAKDICFLNQYRKDKKGTFGVNLIIKGNPKYEEHLKIITENKTPLVITSLGDPTEVIEKVHVYGGTVFCDVTNVKHAEKAQNADGFVAVGQGAGGHAGNISLQVLVPALCKAFPGKIIIGAGGVATSEGFRSVTSLGADGVSAGTVFIASKESEVSGEYKNAIFEAKADDITMTKILSGVPATVIKSDYLYKMEQELKLKRLNLERGIELLQKSGIEADYSQIFVAGQSVEFIEEELSISEIIKNLLGE